MPSEAMTNTMQQDLAARQDSDSDSDSSADSDFRASPSQPGSDHDSSSDETGTNRNKNGKDDNEELASGDEGIVVEGSRKKRKKKGRKGKKALRDGGEDAMDIDEDEDDGVGARLRRRKDKVAEGKIDKPSALARQPVTIDVEDVWARMNRPSDLGLLHDSDKENASSKEQEQEPEPEAEALQAQPTSKGSMIAIEYHHTFAGETTTETKLVPRESAEARLYLQSHSQSTAQIRPITKHLPANGKPMRRPLLQKSKFDTGEYANINTSLARWKLDRKKEQGQKMTTLEKSKLDWAKHVDEQGIREELDAAGKSKGRYLDRMDFLDRSEAMREEELRKERTKSL